MRMTYFSIACNAYGADVSGAVNSIDEKMFRRGGDRRVILYTWHQHYSCEIIRDKNVVGLTRNYDHSLRVPAW